MKDPAALLYVDKWIIATTEMKADARAYYMDMILHQFDKGSLPNDIEELATICRVRISEFISFKEVFEHVLKHKFKQNSEGRLENEFASEIIQKRKLYLDKRSRAGQISYVIRYSKRNLKVTEDQLEFIKSNINIDEIDIKNEHMLKQVLEHLLVLYINEDEDEDINKDISEDAIYLNTECKKYFDSKYLNKKSLDIFDKLIRLDGYDKQQVLKAIQQARGEPFWAGNFLSPLKLRNKDKDGVKYIDRFLAIKQRNNTNPKNVNAVWTRPNQSTSE